MRKISVLMGLFILCMTLNAGNIYAVCTVTGGKVEVSKAGGQACGSINTAANLADNIIVSVLPGTYSEQVTITKSNVKIVGSGQGNTKITSSAAATVTGASSTSIENIWVDNTNATVNGPTAILNVPNINKVKVTASGSNYQTSGIKISSTTNAIISNCDIAVSGDVETLGIAAEGDVTVLNCTIDIKATGPTNQWSTGIYTASTKVTVRDSVITSEGPRYNYAIYIGGHGYVTASNTELKAVSTETTTENKVIRGWESAVTGSKLIATGSAMNNCISDAQQLMIGGSLIQGTNCGNAKIVNSWDENFDPMQYP